MKNILTAIDFSGSSKVVLAQATELAKALDAKLWVVHATTEEITPLAKMADLPSLFGTDYQFVGLPIDIETSRDVTAEKYKHEHSLLHSVTANLREDGLDVVGLLIEGDAAATILQKAVELEAELIVLGSRGHGEIHKLLMGSVCEAVLKDAPCGVLIVPAQK